MTTNAYSPVDPAPLSKVVVAVLFAHLAVSTVYLGANALLLPQLSRPPDEALLRGTAMLQLVSRLASFGVNLVTAVLVLRWIWRTNANAHAFAKKKLEMSPAWAIIWFFVPVAALWMPAQGVEQTWRASKDPWNPKRVATPKLLVWWWWLFVVATLLGAYAIFIGNTRTLAELRFATQVNIFAGLLVMALDLVFIRIVRELTKLQSAQIAFAAFDREPDPLGAAAGGAGVVGAEG